MISIIVPTFNEQKSGIFEQNLSCFEKLPNLEIIVVDGGSSDSTLSLVGTPHHLPNSTRAARINAGLTVAKGNWLVVLHPRSLLEPSALDDLTALDFRKPVWGGWTHKFDHSHLVLRFTSWYSNSIRADLKNIFYLDHCWFLSRELINSLGRDVFPDVSIFEDTLASKRLMKISKPIRLPTISQTSSIRFLKNGIYRQSFINQLAKIKFHLKLDFQSINRQYEAGLNLNERV